MDKKSILIVSVAFPPRNSIGARRVAMIANDLYRNGFEVHVVTLDNSSNNFPGELIIPAQNVHYVNWADPWTIKKALETSKVFSIIGKILGYLVPFTTNHVPERRLTYWIPVAIKESLKIIKDNNIDLIYSSYSPPASLRVASYLKEKTGIPWVNEYRDLWTGNPYFNLNRYKKNLNEKLELKLISNADALITVSEPLKSELIKLHKKPTYTIYNGIDNDFNIKDGICKSEPVRIVYAGAIYKGKRDPLPLFKALNILKRKNKDLYKKISIDFYGPGLQKILNNEINITEVGDIVTLHNPVPHSEILKIQADADILLLLGWNNKADEGVLTGKLFEYLGFKKPILALGYMNGALDMVLTETKAGRIINDPNEIYEYLKMMIKIAKDPRKIGDFRKNIVTEKYLRKNQTKNLIEIISKVIN